MPDTAGALPQVLRLEFGHYRKKAPKGLKADGVARWIGVEGKGLDGRDLEYSCPLVHTRWPRTHKVNANGTHICQPLQPYADCTPTATEVASTTSPPGSATLLLPPVQVNPMDLYCEGWATQQPVGASTKAVHFVRSPVEMAVSAFLYHSNPKCPEAWQFIRPPHPDASLYDPDRCVRARRSDRKEKPKRYYCAACS